MFRGAELDIIDYALIGRTSDTNRDPIIVTKFLGELGQEAGPKSLPSSAKIELAGNIGRLLTSNPAFMPDSQGLLPDAFAIDPTTKRAVLIDVDPYLIRRGPDRVSARLSETSQGAFMRRCGRNIEEWALSDTERTAMATAFCMTAGDVLKDGSSIALIDDFSYPHLMSNGIDPDQLRQMGY